MPAQSFADRMLLPGLPSPLRDSRQVTRARAADMHHLGRRGDNPGHFRRTWLPVTSVSRSPAKATAPPVTAQAPPTTFVVSTGPVFPRMNDRSGSPRPESLSRTSRRASPKANASGARVVTSARWATGKD